VSTSKVDNKTEIFYFFSFSV